MAGEIPLDACGVEAAINMPRSNAAVLTSMRTPSGFESCVASGWEGEMEALCSELDSERPADLDSNVIENVERPVKPPPGRPEVPVAHKATTAGSAAQTPVGIH